MRNFLVVGIYMISNLLHATNNTCYVGNYDSENETTESICVTGRMRAKGSNIGNIQVVGKLESDHSKFRDVSVVGKAVFSNSSVEEKAHCVSGVVDIRSYSSINRLVVDTSGDEKNLSPKVLIGKGVRINHIEFKGKPGIVKDSTEDTFVGEIVNGTRK